MFPKASEMTIFVLKICSLITEMPSLMWDFIVGLEHYVLLAERHLAPPTAVHISLIPKGHSVGAASAQQVVFRRKSRRTSSDVSSTQHPW